MEKIKSDPFQQEYIKKRKEKRQRKIKSLVSSIKNNPNCNVFSYNEYKEETESFLGNNDCEYLRSLKRIGGVTHIKGVDLKLEINDEYYYYIDYDHEIQYKQILKKFFSDEYREKLIVMGYNGLAHPTLIHEVATGDSNSVLPCFSNIAKVLLKSNCSNCTIFHNHPGGNPQESDDDKIVMSHISKVLRFLGIDFHKHYIWTDLDGKIELWSHEIDSEKNYDYDNVRLNECFNKMYSKDEL